MNNHDEPGNSANIMLCAGRATPLRIQRKRVKGYKTPPNTIYVGRPTKWGNPFKVGTKASQFSINLPSNIETVEDAVECYKYYVRKMLIVDPDFLKPLKGKNLSCFCPVGSPCHADVLLSWSNHHFQK